MSRVPRRWWESDWLAVVLVLGIVVFGVAYLSLREWGRWRYLLSAGGLACAMVLGRLIRHRWLERPRNTG
jgi:hypothetical protein